MRVISHSWNEVIQLYIDSKYLKYVKKTLIRQSQTHFFLHISCHSSALEEALEIAGQGRLGWGTHS